LRKDCKALTLIISCLKELYVPVSFINQTQFSHPLLLSQLNIPFDNQ